jgi:AcrR family transcriptional regulator
MLADVNDVQWPPLPTRAAGSIPERVRRPGRPAVRRRLLEAAREVFAEQGYAHARLDDVAAAAGLTKGAIYSNFASKDEVFFAMLEQEVLDRVRAVQAALAAGLEGASGQRGSRAPLTAADIGRYLTTAFTNERSWQLVFVDFWLRAVRDEGARLQFLTHRRALRGAIAEAVERFIGQEPAVGQLSVDDVVTVVLALCNGLAIEQYIDPAFVSEGLFGHVLTALSH